MKAFRIVLLSDLHVGNKARGLDLCPPLSEADQIGRQEDFVSHFESWATSDRATADGPFDMLCVTGDISNSAHPDEFEVASGAIARISAALGLTEDQVFFVPGNHDVHWPVMDIGPFWSRFRYAPLLQDNLTFQRRLARAATGRLDSAPYFACWKAPKAIVVAINSAAYDGPTIKPHNGVIKQETVEQLDHYLTSLPSEEDQLRLCLLHHHIEQHSEPLPDTADFSIAVNAANLVHVLAKHRMDLVLHGHKHYPRMSTHQPSGWHPIVAVCAGSFSSILSPPYYDGIQNMFHVINVSGRETNTARVFGRVDNWVFRDSAWVEATGVGGMYGKEAFGSAATPSEVEQAIRTGLDSRLAGGVHVCKWTDLVTDNPLLGNLRTDMAFETLKKVTEDLGLDMAGDKAVADKKWAIFRRL